MSNLIPAPLTFDELADLLENIAAGVRDGDSWERHISWQLPYDIPVDTDPDDDTPWPQTMVSGTWRIGNRMGQGGMRMLGTPGAVQPPATPGAVQRTDG